VTLQTQTSPDRHRSEKILAGSMVLDSKAIDSAIAHGVNPSAIINQSARQIITTAIDRHARGLPVDVLTVSDKCGLEWDAIEECTDLVMSSAEAGYYAERVARYADLDRFARLPKWIESKVNSSSPDDAIELAAQIGAAVDKAVQSGRLMVAGTLSEAATTWLDRMTAPDEHNVMLDWPLDVITQQMGRVDREVIWIIAQPSVGKTAFILQWLICLALKGHTVSLASLESSAESVASRAISQVAPMNNYHIRQRKATDDEIHTAYDAAKRIPDTIRITDGSMTLDQLYAWGKSEARKGSNIIIVDNTRHIRVTGNGGDRIGDMAAISSRMKDLRDDTGLPVVILHHSTVDRQTGAENAAWSSDIKRDADVMVYLKRDTQLSKEPESIHDEGLDAVRFSVDKNREGRSGYDILLRFRKHIQLFERWVD